jgi:pimeloyl-ACP methyl ester carboxylesterase
LPWIEANGISIYYKLAGNGPVVVLMHELGGTLDSWDEVAPGLSENFTVLRYDQRGSGLSEKVREPYTNDTLVGDLEGVLKGLKLSPPYSFVTVAAAVTHVLGFMQRHPEQVRSFVFGNPAPGVDPARANALIERGVAAYSASHSTNPMRPTSATAPPTRTTGGAISPMIRSISRWPTAAWRRQTSFRCCPTSRSRPWWWPASTTPCARMPAPRSWQRKSRARALS